MWVKLNVNLIEKMLPIKLWPTLLRLYMVTKKNVLYSLEINIRVIAATKKARELLFFCTFKFFLQS
jgi:hypothetical protein